MYNAVRLFQLGDKGGDRVLSEMVRKICLMSCFFAVLLNTVQDGGTRRITEILCTCILMLCILEPFTGFDWEALSAGLAQYHINERLLAEKIAETEKSFGSSVIAEEYASYIQEKANKAGAVIESVKVEVKKDSGGIWVPWRTYICCKETGADISMLSELIEAELGVPKEMQIWSR